MAEFIKDLRPPAPRPNYDAALTDLQGSTRTIIGHIDCGVYPHPALGYDGD